MEKKTILDICRPGPTGVIEVRLRLYNADGSWVYHRTTVPPGVDAAAQMAAVNRNIMQRGAFGISERTTAGRVYGNERDYFDHTELHLPLPDEEIAKVVEMAALVHTPELIARYKTSLL